ncbi:hypothetical protein NDU88_004480 [Pleurodeles waltl]|uniref:Uncharacterized protein n=1 Tax=Pleurodeles waltl TaxID=8319 RepID=A0AAV7UGX6_PLEWA|nr:hypothetical protein NDU88_004480 [Pleurodeles waltl]
MWHLNAWYLKYPEFTDFIASELKLQAYYKHNWGTVASTVTLAGKIMVRGLAKAYVWPESVLGLMSEAEEVRKGLTVFTDPSV